MAERSDFDPLATWQQLVSLWERRVNELASEVSGSQEFSGPMNQLAKLSFTARRSFDETAERMAESMHLATHAQMRSVIERLDRIEEQLNLITSVLAPQQTGAPRASPKRTRRPPGEAGAKP